MSEEIENENLDVLLYSSRFYVIPYVTSGGSPCQSLEICVPPEAQQSCDHTQHGEDYRKRGKHSRDEVLILELRWEHPGRRKIGIDEKRRCRRDDADHHAKSDGAHPHPRLFVPFIVQAGASAQNRSTAGLYHATGMFTICSHCGVR